MAECSRLRRASVGVVLSVLLVAVSQAVSSGWAAPRSDAFQGEDTISLPSCPGSVFAFPLQSRNAHIGWVYRDPEDNAGTWKDKQGNVHSAKDGSGLHSGLDFYVTNSQGGTILVPIYSVGNGYVQSVDGAHHNITIWYPQAGVDAYYGYTSPGYASNYNKGRTPQVGDSVSTGLQIGTMWPASDGFNHLHLSFGLPPYYGSIGDQGTNFGNVVGDPSAGNAQSFSAMPGDHGSNSVTSNTLTPHLDPSSLFNAELNYNRGARRQYAAKVVGDYCHNTSWRSYLPGGVWEGTGVQIRGRVLTFHARVSLALPDSEPQSTYPITMAAGHVIFTLHWAALDRQYPNSPWVVACISHPAWSQVETLAASPIEGMTAEASCSANLDALTLREWTQGGNWPIVSNLHAPSSGSLQVSFDVYDDTTNLRNDAPNGVHVIVLPGRR